MPIDLIAHGQAVFATFKGKIKLATFDVYVEDDKEPCAKAVHTRFVVSESQMQENVARKAAGE